MARNRTRLTRSRIRDVPFNKILPNILTIAGLCVGISSIRYAIVGKWEMAVSAVLIAALFDSMDGRLARILGTPSGLGAQLDSLADFVSFGVAPALILYLFSTNVWHGFGWAVCLMFSVCSALRLARFNTDSPQNSVQLQFLHTKFFTGLSAPIAGILALTPLMLWFEIKVSLFKHPAFCMILLTILAYLMISRIPTYTFKTVRIPQKKVALMLFLFGVAVAGVITAPWPTLLICGAVYLSTIPSSIRSYKKMMQEFAVKDPLPLRPFLHEEDKKPKVVKGKEAMTP